MKSFTFRRFILVLLLSAVIVYARWVEPYWIEITRYSFPEVESKHLKIAHLTDLHIRSMGYRESKVLKILEIEQPDAILITGDSVADNANYEALQIFFKNLQAPLGVWLVRGNWEHWRPNQVEAEVYGSAHVRLLDNSAQELIKGVWLVGVDDVMAGNPDLKQALKDAPKEAFKIGLFHSPAFFDQTDGQLNLALAGHTHGGQIRLPLLPAFWLPEGSGRFVAGWYSKGKSKMYVSRGLGNSILDIRFFCRPELSIIELGH